VVYVANVTATIRQVTNKRPHKYIFNKNEVRVSESISLLHIAMSPLPELGEEHWRVLCHPLEPVNIQTLGMLFAALPLQSPGKSTHTFYIKMFLMYFNNVTEQYCPQLVLSDILIRIFMFLSFLYYNENSTELTSSRSHPFTISL